MRKVCAACKTELMPRGCTCCHSYRWYCPSCKVEGELAPVDWANVPVTYRGVDVRGKTAGEIREALA